MVFEANNTRFIISQQSAQKQKHHTYLQAHTILYIQKTTNNGTNTQSTDKQ